MSSQSRPQLHRGQPYERISSDDTRLQLHPVGQDPLTIDQRLYDAKSAISKTLDILSSNRNNISSLTSTCTTYEQQLGEWFNAYTALEAEHKKIRTDLENMTRSHDAVSRQLSTIQGYEAELQVIPSHPGQNRQGGMREYQAALAQANDKLTASQQELNGVQEIRRELQNDLTKARSQLDTAQETLEKLCKEKEYLIRELRDMLGAAKDRAAMAEGRIVELEKQQLYEHPSLRELETARKRIATLEKEKADMVQEHRDALATSNEAAGKRIAELEEKAELIREHQDALAKAGEAVEARITEFEKEYELENMSLTAGSGGLAAVSPVASPKTIPSPTRKRPRRGSRNGRGVEQEYRKHEAGGF
ncbi:hypothetical protein BGZ60DRAFT_550900 [Tricladium varicosporioides]|nr:hypothetical protein BGZ60DRAFT_550900 [Hymenoscyphus varicosporioides]